MALCENAEMFRQRTTIVVGAGASCEIGLPSGDALKRNILNLLKPANDNAYGFVDDTLVQLMKLRGGPNVWDYQSKLAPVKEAATKIRKGLPLAVSIDNFLHTHHGDIEIEQLGKLAIAISILRAEASSYLFTRNGGAMLRTSHPNIPPTLTIRGDNINKSWHPSLVQLLFSGIQRDDIALAFENVKFVIFNYDRCLEQYIWMAMQDYFDISGEEAAEILANVSFIHPYGYLGPLPWRSNNSPVELGSADLSELARMQSRIRTFTESVRSEVGGKVKYSVEWAETLVILGFGYLDQNIQLLSREGNANGKRVFSTAFGISAPDQDVMRNVMMGLGGVDFHSTMIEPGSCRNLFDNFRLHLSLR
jgi:hypothetical protein